MKVDGTQRRYLALGILFALMLISTSVPAEVKRPVYTDITGTKVDLDSYRGKWVVVNYWATWCPPCLEEIPELVHFHETHKDKDAVVLGINMEEIPAAALSEFVEENMMTYPVLPMSEEMPQVGHIPGLPTTYLIDPAGRTVASKVGQVTTEMLESFINKNNR